MKLNKDGKFVNFGNLPNHFGYCHSCGKASLPQTTYRDSFGDEYFWNDDQKRFEKKTDCISNVDSLSSYQQLIVKKEQQFIDEAIIWKYFHIIPESPLLLYLRKTYGDAKTHEIKEIYSIGSTTDGGTIFWSINDRLKVQKAKIVYYDCNGRRKNKFKVPYKNEDGFYTCLFGQHLITSAVKGKQTIVLVESEKTAIVGHVLMPKFIWIAYGGCNGLTTDKLQPLIGHNVLIIPDMSENAVSIILGRIPLMLQMGIHVKIWDLTEGKTDEQLKLDGVYNNDLEDVFREL